MDELAMWLGYAIACVATVCGTLIGLFWLIGKTIEWTGLLPDFYQFYWDRLQRRGKR